MPSTLSNLTVLSKKNKIYDFGQIPVVMDVPYLLETQKKSYEDFLQKDVAPKERKDLGLQEAFTSIFPVTSPSTPSTLNFEEYSFGVPKYSIKECTERGMSFSVPLKVKLQLIVREENEATGQMEIRDIKEQEAYMGEMPLMTEQGTFIINGAERVIVSQLHRSPGVSFSSSIHPNGKTTYSARVIPYRGAWIEFEIDISNVMNVIVDRRRKIPATAFLRILGLSTDEEIAREFFEVEKMQLDDFKKGATKLAELPKFVGESIVEEIHNPKTGKRMAAPGTKVTKKLIEQFKQAGIKKVVLNVAEAYDNILGRYLAEDVVDTSTGEILGECFDQVTTVFLMKCAESKINECSVIKVQHEDTNVILCTLAKDKSKNREDAFIEFFKKMRPGNPISLQAATRLVDETFFNEKRYDLGLVGRHKIANRFKETKTDEEVRTLTCEDVVSIMSHMLKLVNEEAEVDDIDHLGNRRVRSVGELLQNHVRMALAEVEKTARERMGIIDLENMLPHNLINSKPVDSAIKDFFGRSQLSQFMDQTNPLSELTHKRRLSALGPGGLSRDRAGFEVRDVHHTHYGRICPIETPEGPNIGLISSLCTYARVNPYGFIETPYRKVVDGKVTKDIDYLTADVEDEYRIAQANAVLEDDGSFADKMVQCRYRGDFLRLKPNKIDYMDISPKQVVSVSASLIPFLENDDANRALMGSNMMRQGVPLLYTDFPVVGTGMEGRVAQDSGVTLIARNAGEVIRSTAREIIIRNDMGEEDYYSLVKFRRSNQSTCINQKPIVFEGDKVKKGEVLADGPATKEGVLALGRNVMVAFMPWGGYNFEDAIIISERLVTEDVYTSLHIEEFEIDARDTKLGKEEITRDIPNVSEEALAKLDEDGLVYVGAEVNPGDILVGKVTPKGETELTSEEKLLRVIFGEKAGDVRDASLRCPPGTQGIVVDIKVFSRKERTSASDRHDKEAIAAIDIEMESQLSELWADFTEKLTKLLEKIDRPIVNYDGSSVMRPGGKVTDKVVHYVRNSLKTGMLPVEGEVGAEVKSLYQDVANREFAIEEIAKNRKDRIKTGDELAPGVIKLIKVYVATKRKISIGDKMAGRHGNKGVISKILPVEDMPFLEDGTPVDIILNPLGVPSRMNVGQILETHLGWAADKLGIRVATPVFDGAQDEQIRSVLKEVGLPESGQATLYDGLTGEPFSRPVTVGMIYMLKLAHMVDDKMHARSIGPYSLVTQQPLGGKAQFGGQRFGEMEVWALEAYGAANTLQELLTVKSDDVVGRTKIYESIIKGHNALSPGVPESFNVLVKELQGLCLNMELLAQEDLEGPEGELEDELYEGEFDEAEIDEADLQEMDAFGLDDEDAETESITAGEEMDEDE